MNLIIFFIVSVKPATPAPGYQNTEADVASELVSLGRKYLPVTMLRSRKFCQRAQDGRIYFYVS